MTPRFAALSRLEANTASSASILLLSPAVIAALSFFCCDLIPVSTDLFCWVRAMVCLARFPADRVFAMSFLKKETEPHIVSLLRQPGIFPPFVPGSLKLRRDKPPRFATAFVPASQNYGGQAGARQVHLSGWVCRSRSSALEGRLSKALNTRRGRLCPCSSVSSSPDAACLACSQTAGKPGDCEFM
jgi:hypothetical protein